MADYIYINPKILKWARESARISIDTASSKISISPQVLENWENGFSRPTVRQAEKLAKVYKRPFAIFFLPEVPIDFHPLQDYRKSDSTPLSTASIFIIREIQQKQAWIKELFEENNHSPLPFVGKFSIDDNPQIVAQDIIATLQIENHIDTVTNPIIKWIDKIENIGIFVSRTSFIHSKLLLDSNEIQGFVIADKYAPFIFINTEDWNTAQLFTLIHELAHIWIDASGVSNEIKTEEVKDKLHPIELFCNEVAANVLMPNSLMENLDFSIWSSESTVFKAAKNIGVSSLALITRAMKLKIISFEKYKTLKNEAEIAYLSYIIREEEKLAKQKKQDGGPNYYLLMLNKNSKLFTQIVLDAFRGGAIQPTVASSLLNTKVNNFSKLEAVLYK